MAIAKPLFFLSGLPRSGSTLLTNILGQNPEIGVTPTSGLLDMLLQVKNQWDRNAAFRAQEQSVNDEKKLNVLQAMINGYFQNMPETSCIDKNRGWPASLEMAEALLGDRQAVKVLVTVRDLRDILASFERLHRKTAALGATHQEHGDPKKSRTAAGRMEILIDKDQPVGRAFNSIRDAFTRGWADRMLLVEYDKLTSEPRQTLGEIYDFLELPTFAHDFDNVEQITTENDAVHGFRDLHKVRQKVEAQEPQWPKMFDQVVRDEPVWQQVEQMSQFWRAYQAAR